MKAALRIEPPAEGEAGFDRTALAGANVNPRTLLATDYLNHFNEVVMLIDMLTSMPECIHDLEDWEEMSYWEHFAVSGLRYAPVAIEAYGHAPRDVRARFDEAVEALNAATRTAILACRAALQEGETDALYHVCKACSRRLTLLIEAAGAIINGQPPRPRLDEHPQDAVDALFPG